MKSDILSIRRDQAMVIFRDWRLRDSFLLISKFSNYKSGLSGLGGIERARTQL